MMEWVKFSASVIVQITICLLLYGAIMVDSYDTDLDENDYNAQNDISYEDREDSLPGNFITSDDELPNYTSENVEFFSSVEKGESSFNRETKSDEWLDNDWGHNKKDFLERDDFHHKKNIHNFEDSRYDNPQDDGLGDKDGHQKHKGREFSSRIESISQSLNYDQHSSGDGHHDESSYAAERNYPEALFQSRKVDESEEDLSSVLEEDDDFILPGSAKRFSVLPKCSESDESVR